MTQGMTSPSNLQAFRASLLWFPDPQIDRIQFESDGLLVTERGPDGISRVVAIGSYPSLQSRFADLPLTDWRGHWIAPGFVDMHIHFPQTDVIGSPADGLLPWLENYTFVQEARFADPAHAAETATFFLDELQRQGVTTALTFCSSHPASVDALMGAAQALRRHRSAKLNAELNRLLQETGDWSADVADRVRDLHRLLAEIKGSGPSPDA